MLIARIVRVPVMEPDSDGPYRVGWTHGIELRTEAGSVLTNARIGAQGSETALRKLMEPSIRDGTARWYSEKETSP